MSEVERLRQELHELKNGITKQTEEQQQQARRQHFEQQLSGDVDFLAGVSATKHAEEYPFYSVLPDNMRKQMAREVMLNHIREQTGAMPRDVLDELDELAEPIVQQIRGQSGTAPRQNGDGNRVQGARGAPAPKPPGRVDARAAAAPAGRRERKTDKDRRAAALRVARERSGS